MQSGDQVGNQQIVSLFRPRHGEHFAVVILALVVCCALDLDIAFRCEERLRLSGHSLAFTNTLTFETIKQVRNPSCRLNWMSDEIETDCRRSAHRGRDTAPDSERLMQAHQENRNLSKWI